VTDSNRPVLLVGSVSLPSTDDVFAAVSKHLAGDVRSVPDGETGDRGLWVSYELQRLAELPEIVVLDDWIFNSPVHGEFNNPILGAAEGVNLADVRFGPFSYAKDAPVSYKRFVKERDAGKFSPETRFQVSIPTPMMFALMFPGHRLEALAAFERDLGETIATLLEQIPHEDLALQWDCAGELVAQEQFRQGDQSLTATGDQWPWEEIADSIVRASAGIPEDVLLGVHLCFGSPEDKHLVEPKDLSLAVEVTNRIAENLGRRLDWIHRPVPIERTDDAYYAPLAELRLAPQTQLYLGLLHKEDGIEGAKKRIAVASKYVKQFGIGTECGMGRTPTEAIDGLLKLHHEAASLQ
jgi:hypothetical protein